MIERLIISLAVVMAGTAVYLLFRRLHLWRLNRQNAAGTGQPLLLYFSSEGCAACPTQGRYLEQLAAVWNGRFTLRKIDADVEPETAVQYGVFTLPTTILVDGHGAVRQINYGLTNAHKLAKQLETMYG